MRAVLIADEFCAMLYGIELRGKQDEDLAFFHLEETTSTMDAIRDTLASGQVREILLCEEVRDT